MWCLGESAALILILTFSISADNPDSSEYYYQKAARSEDPTDAIDLWQRIARFRHRGRYYFLAQLELAKNEFFHGDYQKVIKRLKPITTGVSSPEIKGEILFWLGLARLEISYDEGVKTLNDLILGLPETRWAGRARAIAKVTSGRYMVQTGAFKTKRYALRQYHRLRELGFDARVVEKRIGDIRYYRVVVGSFGTIEKGMGVADSLRKLGFKEARVISY